MSTIEQLRGIAHRFPCNELMMQAANELESLQKALEAAQQRIKRLVEVLKITEAHVDWGDCTLENVHEMARELLATEALENKQG